MSWKLIISKSSRKFLRKIPKKDAERVFLAFQELAVNPYSGDIAKMKDKENEWRRRVGAYRIFYEMDENRKIIDINYIKRALPKLINLPS